MGHTLAEKILAQASGASTVEPNNYVTAQADRIMLNDMICLVANLLEDIGVDKLHDPEKIVVVLDHIFPAPSAKHAELLKSGLTKMKRFKLPNILGPIGIAHQVLSEQGFIHPGKLVLGTDSHSTLYGAFGAAGAGIGATDMTYLMVTGELWMQVPQSVKINLEGQLPAGVTAKDVVLNVIGQLGGDYGRYKSIEYHGGAAQRMTMSQRMTIANMGAELGAKFALFEADHVTLDYLSSRTDEELAEFRADEDAHYEAEHCFDLSDLEPQIACPHSPDNVHPISAVKDVSVQQAYLGSCTNARLDDLALAAGLIEGHKVASSTQLIVAPASQQVMLDATRAGHIEKLVAAGATIVPAGCGACAGVHSGLLAAGDVCLSSTNRNFQGRMGSPDAEVYLGSPAMVIAAAITGKITDPREFMKDL